LYIIISPDLSSINRPEDLDWEKAIAKMAALIIAEQTPSRLLQIRGQLYDIITKCIQPSVILKRLSFYLVEQVPEPVKIKIIEQAAFHVNQKDSVGMIRVIHYVFII
jgi:replication factor C subunit 3/5